jgi:acyl-CoA synthetase (AMP-forming)/AMP-acid ligase II
LLGERQGEVVQYDYQNKMIKRDENGWAVKCTPGEEGVLICAINLLNRFYTYVNDLESSEKVLLEDVFQAGDQYFFSGDLMLLHEFDYISYVDRLGDTYRWKGRTVSANQVADVIKKFYGGIEDAVVYAVKIPGQEGRCGMAAIKLLEDETLDLGGFIKHIDRRMPEHARPLFLRLVKELKGEQDAEEGKEILRQEGFDPDIVKDPLYFLHPEIDRYVPLHAELYQKIIAQEILL